MEFTACTLQPLLLVCHTFFFLVFFAECNAVFQLHCVLRPLQDCTYCRTHMASSFFYFFFTALSFCFILLCDH